jgi:hypothetical protein
MVAELLMGVGMVMFAIVVVGALVAMGMAFVAVYDLICFDLKLGKYKESE